MITSTSSRTSHTGGVEVHPITIWSVVVGALFWALMLIVGPSTPVSELPPPRLPVTTEVAP